MEMEGKACTGRNHVHIQDKISVCIINSILSLTCSTLGDTYTYAQPYICTYSLPSFKHLNYPSPRPPYPFNTQGKRSCMFIHVCVLYRQEDSRFQDHNATRRFIHHANGKNEKCSSARFIMNNF